MSKIEVDVEKLLSWAYVEELSKRHTSAAEGIWDRIEDYGNHGGIDKGHGAAQRYSHFGLPDPDAEAVERAVASLGEVEIDWNLSLEPIAGDLAGLVSVNDMSRNEPAQKRTKVGWGESGTKALKAFFGEDGVRPSHDRPRDVLLLNTINLSALVTRHAIKGSRPDWWDEHPVANRTPAKNGGGVALVGECKGKNVYSTGSYCPLQWSPSPTSIISSRAEYALWHLGLTQLACMLELKKHVALPPKASATPWVDGIEAESRVIPVVPNGRNSVKLWGVLPLEPHRGRTGSSLRSPKAGPVRYPLATGQGA
ncbi:hypothetical protein ABIA95_000195 [Bradyrhizobium sp. LA8.1]|uniref:hypothetical protein n=1 Tax=unclassified Bradyrhizobium TaxID=2631580 RepID=UPI0033937A4F